MISRGSSDNMVINVSGDINVEKISKLSVREAVKYLEKKCLKNTTYALKPITFDDLTRFAEEVNREEEEKENYSKKI